MIDWQRVDELRNDVGAEDFAEVIEIFLEEVEAVMSDIRPGAAPDRLGEQLHFLKGSALNLGFRGFAELCAEDERRAAAGGAVDLAGIEQIYDASRAAFLSGTGARAANCTSG
ncbi:histidine kinase [Maritimibacter sp. 55A14]|uniref:Hpt domain-containing protein n=1 Tax=Maritimibacter sp. 55A14 TaxID=2174844 RepID=UPI000D617C55|nr:Hpt domain-containing protein [Maritimibacter sp. 55A14]PWE30041.1 histidine kinase [Maritimibacter sp. 55A14]